MHIPFAELHSDAEFVGNILIQMIVGGHGGLCYIGMEVIFSLVQNVVTIASKLVKSDIDNAIQLYEEKSISDAELYWRIGRIVKTSIDTDK